MAPLQAVYEAAFRAAWAELPHQDDHRYDHSPHPAMSEHSMGRLGSAITVSRRAFQFIEPYAPLLLTRLPH